MKKNLPSIIIVDDHDLFRDGLKTLLELGEVGNVIGEASNGLEFLEIIKDKTPDVVLMDIDMPKLNGIEALNKALEIYPDIKILIVSMFSDYQYYYDMFSSGAKGFVFKTANKSELIGAIQTVLNGGSFFSAELLQEMVLKFRNEKQQESRTEVKFNEKEIEIISYMVDGLSAKEIAVKANLSPKTVSNYKTLMLEKTGCKNAVSLVVYAIRHSLIHI